MEQLEATIISDGAASVEGEGGSACIITGFGAIPRMKLMCYLGAADSVEAELFGALLGLSFVHACPLEPRIIHWFCDNRSLVDGAMRQLPLWQQSGWRLSGGGSVRHQALWEVFIALRAPYRVEARHVQRDGPNRDHRACDRASRWAQRSGLKLLAKGGERRVGRLAERAPDDAWLLLDAVALLNGIRGRRPAQDCAAELVAAVSKHLR